MNFPYFKRTRPGHVETIVQGLSMEAEEKALVKKIDILLLPTIWLMYLLSYMDRTK